MTTIIAALLATASISAPPAATASEVTAATAPEQRWYGYQTLAADAASAAFFAADVHSKAGSAVDTALGVTFVAGFWAAPPIIHLAHGRYWRAAGSLALRLALPIIGGGIGSAFTPPGPRIGPSTEQVGGMIAGMVGASLADAAFLGWEPEPAPRLSLAPASSPDGARGLGLLARW